MSTFPASTPTGAATADLCLPATLAAATQARHALAALTPDPLLAEDGQLLVTEAVANAVEHTDATQIHILLRHEPDDQRLLCAVRDASPLAPQPRAARIPVDLDAEDGRGLRLIDAVAEAWGYLPDETGKWLWFALTSTARAA